jgi:hypothetical protein
MAMFSLKAVSHSLTSALLLLAVGTSWAAAPAPGNDPSTPAVEVSTMAQTVAAPSATPHCTATLKPFKASYQSQGFGLELIIKRFLTHNADGSWTATANTSRLFFTMNETADFTVSNAQIKPMLYRYEQTAGGKKNRDWHFDYTNNTVTNENPKQPWTLPLQAGAQDRFTHQLQIGLDLACDPTRTADLVYGVPDRNKYDEYRFAIRGHETLDTALGKIDTIKLERLRGDNKRQDIIWVAPQWNYQMVLLRHVEKGETTDTKIISLELDGKVIKK